MTEQTLDPHLQNGFAESRSTDRIKQAAGADTVKGEGTTPAESENVASEVSNVGAWGESSDGEDFNYIPVSPWAPISLFLGLLGLTGFIGIFGLYVAFFGIFIGIAAISRIRASAGFVKGSGLAAIGLVLSIASFGLGSAKMAYAYSTEVPEGYLRVNFPKDVAEKQFVFIGGHRKLHPDVAPLIGEKVYLKGFMWATRDTEGLTRFILLKDNGECCFGGSPKSHDFITVTLASFDQGERPPLSYRASSLQEKKLTKQEKEAFTLEKDFQLTTPAFLGMVAVAGILEADVKAGENGPPADYELAPVYSINAELVEEAWTKF